MSYFDMINFEESTLLEGKQAEEYKARKEREGLLNARKEAHRANRRLVKFTTGSKYSNLNPNYQKDFEKGIKDGDQEAAKRWYDRLSLDNNRSNKAAVIVNSNIDRDKVGKIEHSQAKDAINRHIRRHPKNYKEMAELIEAYNPEYIDL